MKCKICQQDKPEKYFYAYKKNNKEYHKKTCAICITSIKRERYKKDKEYRDKLKKQALVYAHTPEGKIKRKENQSKRIKTDKFKQYHKKWEKNTEKGRASMKRRRSKWLKTLGGKVYMQRKRALRIYRLKENATLTKNEWQEILNKFNNKCAYCGEKAEAQDHIIPLSKGGHHTKENVVPACKSCNSKKGDKIWKVK